MSDGPGTGEFPPPGQPENGQGQPHQPNGEQPHGDEDHAPTTSPEEGHDDEDHTAPSQEEIDADRQERRDDPNALPEQDIPDKLWEQGEHISNLAAAQSRGEQPDLGELNAHFRRTNEPRENAEVLLSALDLTDEQREEVLEGLPSMTDEEQAADELSEDDQDHYIDIISQQSDQAKELAASIEADNSIGEEDKVSYMARLRTLNKRLEEMKVKKIARGIGKAAVLSMIILMLLFIWELQLFGKASKKK